MPLLYGSPSSATLQPSTWKSYTELHAGLLLGASLPPPPPYSFLSLPGPFLLRTCSASPPRLLQPLCPGNKKCGLSTKKETLLEIILFFGTQSLPSPHKTLIMGPPFLPWTATHFTVSPFIPDCTGNITVRLQSASNRLSSLPLSDIQVWTDGSALPLFGPGGAGVYVTCSKCNTSYSLSFSTGPIASSFIAETFALKQGLDWCTSHFMTCKFQSVLFLTDSQSTLSILSSAPSYLLPESLWNVWSLASSLSNNTTLSFQWVPSHAGLPGNENADLLAKTGASLPTDAIPCPLPSSLPKSVIFSNTIGNVTSPTPI